MSRAIDAVVSGLHVLHVVAIIAFVLIPIGLLIAALIG